MASARLHLQACSNCPCRRARLRHLPYRRANRIVRDLRPGRRCVEEPHNGSSNRFAAQSDVVHERFFRGGSL